MSTLGLTLPATFPAGFLALDGLVLGMLCAVVMVLVYRQRAFAPSVLPLMVILAAAAVWNVAYAMYWAQAPFPSQEFWFVLSYVAVIVAPTAFLAFAARFSGRDAWLTPRVKVLLAVEPAVAVFALATDGSLHLFGGSAAPWATVFADQAGVVFWVNLAYSYMLLAAASLLLASRAVSVHGKYRQQALIVLGAAAVPWTVSVVMLSGAERALGADLTPLAMAASAVALAYAVVHYRLLHVSPVARATLMEHLRDGVLVVDTDERLTDVNDAARALLGLGDSAVVGMPLAAALASCPAVRDVLVPAVTGVSLVSFVPVGASASRSLEVDVLAFSSPRRRPLGRLVVIRDTTSRVAMAVELERLASTDPLTGLANRRAFEVAGSREVDRARRSGIALAVAMVDVDFLKELNDSSGHAAGDAAIVRVARELSALRTVDVAARVGGDEFAVLLPAADESEAAAILARVVARLAVPDATGLVVSVTAGVAALGVPSPDLGALLRDADAALYAVKRTGRGRVGLFSSVPPSSTPAVG